MGPEMAELARTAGTTMVTLMATQAWESTREGVLTLWRRFQPDRAETVGGELEATREDLLLARESETPTPRPNSPPNGRRGCAASWWPGPRWPTNSGGSSPS